MLDCARFFAGKRTQPNIFGVFIKSNNDPYHRVARYTDDVSDTHIDMTAWDPGDPEVAAQVRATQNSVPLMTRKEVTEEVRLSQMAQRNGAQMCTSPDPEGGTPGNSPLFPDGGSILSMESMWNSWVLM